MMFKNTLSYSRSHALRGNAYQNAPRSVIQKVSSYIFISLLLCLSLTSVTALAEISLKKNNLILDKKHGDDGSAWGNPRCDACHVRRNIHNSKAGKPIRDIVLQVGPESCAGCHGQNGTKMPQKCTICHNSNLLPATPLIEDKRNHNFNVDKEESLTDKNCLSCHDASDMDGNFELNVDLTHFKAQSGIDLPYKNHTEFCLRCHNKDQQQPGFEMEPRFPRDPLVTMAVNYKYIDKHGYVDGSGERLYAGLRDGYEYGTLVECTDCHAMHGTHNQKLMIDRTDIGATLLEDDLRDKPVYIDVDNGDYAEHCVVCHKSDVDVEETDEDTGNGLNGVHQVNGACTDCHVHGMAVQTGL